MRWVFFLVAVFIASVLYGQSDKVAFDSLANHLNAQRYQFPQEKIHVKTDKAYYSGGDTIWFRAFVVDASTHEPIKISKYVYAELKTPYDSLLCRVKIQEVGGIYAGYMAIPPKVAEGDYTLCAYTLFMGSVGEDYYFKKNIQILSPYATQSVIDAQFEWDKQDLLVNLSYRDKNTNQLKPYKEMIYSLPNGKSHIKRLGDKAVTFRLKGKDMQAGCVYVSFNNYRKYILLPPCPDMYAVTFHPEGGYIIAESPCNVAFKAINSFGLGENVKGVVVDSLGNEVTKFESVHAGMGMFTFIPRSGQRYSAICENSNGSKVTVALPSPAIGASVLKVTYPTKSTFAVSILCDKKIEDSSYRLVIVQRGNLLHSSMWNENNEYLSFRKADFPNGVLQVLLLDCNGATLSERMLFIKENDNSNATVSCKSNQEIYASREKVILNVQLSNVSIPACNYAVAVTDNNSVVPDTISSIEISLLLNSELKGNIEKPYYYFINTDSHAEIALDALMLTQGWNRYDIPKVLKGKYDFPTSTVEIGQEISGDVRSTLFNKPLKSASINILSPKVNFYNIAKSDSAGRFLFNGFDFPDGTKYVLQAFTEKNKQIMNIRVDSFPFPATSACISSPNISHKKDMTKFVEQEKKRYQYNDGMRSILLDEVIVSRTKYKAPEDIFEALATRTFDYTEFKEIGATSVEEILRKIPGVVIDRGNVMFRRGTVAFYLDGVYQEPLITAMPAPTKMSTGSDNRTPTATKSGSEAIPFIVPDDKSSSMSILSEIEKIPFEMIKRIDFLRPNDAVILGSQATGGGALMITTKRGGEGLAWEQPSNIENITPLGYQKPIEFYSPQYDVSPGSQSMGYDLRNTVYWNPCVKTGKNGKSNIEFYTTDASHTHYTVSIEGVTPAGELFQKNYLLTKE